MNVTFENIFIREATAGDAKQLAAWWNDGAIMAHAGFPNGLGTTADKVREDLLSPASKNSVRHIIEVGGVAIGEMNYRTADAVTSLNVDRADGKTAEIGIKICDADYQNKGYGTKILRLFIRTLFEDYGFEKVVLDTNIKNLRAQKVYENKLGFRRVKVQDHVFQNQLGEWQTVIFYELTPGDF